MFLFGNGAEASQNNLCGATYGRQMKGTTDSFTNCIRFLLPAIFGRIHGHCF